jgi:ribose transport system substrate-binding protein
LIAVDAQNDAAKQTNDVEDLIQKGVDVVVINPPLFQSYKEGII